MQKFLSGVGSLILAVVFIGAGIFSLIMGINKIRKLDTGKYAEVQATITKIDSNETYDPDTGTHTEYYITVEYTVNGKKYVSQLGETPSDFHEGMELTVLYEIDDPAEVTLPGKTGAYIAIALGAIGILVGGVVIFKKVTGR